MWLDGFQPVVFNHSTGGDFTRSVRGVCFHTTEGSSAQGAFSVYASQQACPHVTVEYDVGARYQHVPLNRSAYALQRGDNSHPCNVQTNRSGIIQIEVVGFAGQAGSWPDAELEWLGTQVLAPILDACPGIPWDVYHGDRMGEAAWEGWPGGLCGHCHVCCQPAGHWDPGDADLDKILAYATGDDMPLSDDDVHRVAEAVWSRRLDIEGSYGTAAEWIGWMYAEITRTEAQGGKLMKNIGDLLDDKVITVD